MGARECGVKAAVSMNREGPAFELVVDSMSAKGAACDSEGSWFVPQGAIVEVERGQVGFGKIPDEGPWP